MSTNVVEAIPWNQWTPLDRIAVNALWNPWMPVACSVDALGSISAELVSAVWNFWEHFRRTS